MTDKKISELTNILGSQVDDANDELAIVDSSAGTTNSITRAELLSSVSAMSITGDLTVSGSTSLDSLSVDTDTLYVDSANNRVGIGVSSPAADLHINETQPADAAIRLSTSNDGWNISTGYNANNNVDLVFSGSNSGAGSTEHMRIDSSGNVGIGTSSPEQALHVFGNAVVEGSSANLTFLETDTTDQNHRQRIQSGDLIFERVTDAFALSGESMRIDSSGNVGIGTSSTVSTLTLPNDGMIGWASTACNIQATSSGPDYIKFSTSSSEAMRIDSGGNLLVGHTVAVGDVVSAQLRQDGVGIFIRDSDETLFLNRLTNDGVVVDIRQDTTREGTISVSGTTVSYNGGHLSRWSRLPDGTDDTHIYKGTVMTNLDEMCEWRDEEGDLEENEQLNKTTVSTQEGDPNVAGLFVAWDEDDDWGDYYLAMTGDLVIRIAQGVTVQRGDLLMSAGDGTAKPQGDDIVRSKTVAKVTSTNISHTYPDGSYAVPCVVMAC